MNQRRLLISNSIASGIRAFASMAIGLVLTPILLHNLGEQLFGFAVTVGASGSLLGIVSSNLNLSISRELTFWVGADNMRRLRQAFASACLLQSVGGSLVCIVGFLASHWIVSCLTVPDGYQRSAVIALWLISIDYALTFMTSPYHALLIAHQKLGIYSVVMMLKRIRTLVAALIVPLAKDGLLAFIGCQVLLNIPINFWPVWLGLRHDSIARPTLSDIDKSTTKSILRYGALSFLSGVGSQLRRNGVAVFLNIVFGNVVAAASVIGIRLAGIIQQFLSIFMPVIRPAITASTGAKNDAITRRLVTLTSTLTLAVALPLVVPILTDAEPLLRFWLRAEVPEYATIFAQLMALTLLANMLSKGHELALHATGRVAILVTIYQGCIVAFLVVGAVATYYMQSHPWIVQLAELLGVIVAAGMWQPNWVCNTLDIDIRDWLWQTLRPFVLLAVCCGIFAFFVCLTVDTSVQRAILLGVGCGIMSAWTVWQFVLNQNEREVVTGRFMALVKKAIL